MHLSARGQTEITQVLRELAQRWLEVDANDEFALANNALDFSVYESMAMIERILEQEP